METSISIGVIAIVTRIVVTALRKAGLPDRVTPLAALGIGASLFILSALYTGADAFAALISGILAGGAAVGLYELQKQTFKPLSDGNQPPEG